MPHTGLAVIEARWWTSGNDSVRPLFETLSGIIEDNPHLVRYDMFADRSSLSAIIDDVADSNEFHSIYIGSHGNDKSIGGIGSCSVSRTELRNIFNSKNSSAHVKGLYFGSCMIGTLQNASFWLIGRRNTHLDWVAGYTKSVDWIDSSAIDMIFWSKYLRERSKNRHRGRNKKTEVQMVKHAASELKSLIPTIFDKMGFNIYYLSGGGGVDSEW